LWFLKLKFREKSSRDSGLIETNGYKELYDTFWDKALKRLEKYVVSVQWSLDEVIRNKDGDSDDFSILDNTISQSGIIDIITNLVNKDKVEIKDFDANFINLFDEQKPSEVIVSKLSKIAHDVNNQELIDKINETQKIIRKLEQGNKNLKKEITKEQQRTEQLSKNLETEKKQNIFQRSLIGTEKEQILGLQHQIRHSSSRINRNTKLLLKTFNAPLSLISTLSLLTKLVIISIISLWLIVLSNIEKSSESPSLFLMTSSKDHCTLTTYFSSLFKALSQNASYNSL
jgi:exonuclease VII large subunit